MECHLGIMHGRPHNPEVEYATNGNILLDRLYGAVVHDIAWDEERNRGVQLIASALLANGRRPFVIPYGASDKLGAMGYVLAAEEIIRQCPDVKWIVHGSGSGGTQAGLVAGLLALRHPARVIGIDVDAQPERVASDVNRIGYGIVAMLGTSDLWRDDNIEVVGNWSGPAYGEPDTSTEEAILLAARLEGLALDPVYSGKAMAGLIGLARQGRFHEGGSVVWIHTGGAPGIFAYPSTMKHIAMRKAALSRS